MNKKEFAKMPYLKVEYHTNITEDDFVETDKPIYITDYYMKENIDKIKLPCFCTFEWIKRRRLGILLNDNYKFEAGIEHNLFKLHEIDKQTSHKVGGLIAISMDLKDLIQTYKINIGKAKITYCEIFNRKDN